jgi:hypothetical protein|nr:MAG TPA: hypothetical protein [Caudoviricetes sp.]
MPNFSVTPTQGSGTTELKVKPTDINLSEGDYKATLKITVGDKTKTVSLTQTHTNAMWKALLQANNSFDLNPNGGSTNIPFTCVNRLVDPDNDDQVLQTEAIGLAIQIQGGEIPWLTSYQVVSQDPVTGEGILRLTYQANNTETPRLRVLTIYPETQSTPQESLYIDINLNQAVKEDKIDWYMCIYTIKNSDTSREGYGNINLWVSDGSDGFNKGSVFDLGTGNGNDWRIKIVFRERRNNAENTGRVYGLNPGEEIYFKISTNNSNRGQVLSGANYGIVLSNTSVIRDFLQGILTLANTESYQATHYFTSTNSKIEVIGDTQILPDQFPVSLMVGSGNGIPFNIEFQDSLSDIAKKIGVDVSKLDTTTNAIVIKFLNR